jgi:hypothetical protein
MHAIQTSTIAGSRSSVTLTVGQLVRTGEQRLFRLRDLLASRYEELSGVDLLSKAGEIDEQLDLTSALD